MADLIPMKTLTVGDKTFEIVDEKARNDISKLSGQINSLVGENTTTVTTEKVALTDMTSYLLKSGGNLVATSSTNLNRVVSEPVVANAGEKYLFTCSANYGNALYVIYDKSGESIGEVKADATTEGNVLTEHEVIMPEGTYYFRLACNKDNLPDGYSALKVVEKTETSLVLQPLKGKKVVFIGDSITEKNNRATKNYIDFIVEKTGIEAINLGVGGTGYANGFDEEKAFYHRVENAPTDADAYIFFGSFNDMSVDGYVLGNVNEHQNIGIDTDITVCGYINATIDKLYERVPLANIGIITPTPWMYKSPDYTSSPNTLYVDAIIEICKLDGIPCLDMYRSSGLRPWDATFRELAYSKDDGDGTHPDETGHEKFIAPKVKAFLETLLM